MNAEMSSDAQYRVTGQELGQFIERVERLEQEKQEVADRVREASAEIKACGDL